MILAADQKRVILQVLNAFETGSAEGNYADISIFHDGPGDRRQITYGRSQTTEYGHLRELLTRYVDAPKAGFAGVLRPYVPRIGHVPLVDDHNFLGLLEEAGHDLVMHEVQDQFFEDVYFQPALYWAESHGFILPLSMLVIFDSFIHSGGILASLRSRFPAMPPGQGGNEKEWVEQYVSVRNDWLANHRRPALHNTTYRTRMLLREILHNNWDLSERPIDAHGVKIL